MRKIIVADGYTIINTQGIRFAERRDVTFSGGYHDEQTHYYLRVTYKGSVLDFKYPTAATRDAQFAALSATLVTGSV